MRLSYVQTQANQSTLLPCSLSDNFAWAAEPLIRRLSLLQPELKVTVIYGEESWISPRLTETETEAHRKNISILTIPDATHHVYVDQFEMFNEIVLNLLH